MMRRARIPPTAWAALLPMFCVLAACQGVVMSPEGLREHGWFGMERLRWQDMFGLADEDLVFFSKHEEADIIHSDIGWKTVAERAAELHMEDAVIQACIDNLLVWEIYLNGIADGADKIG